MVGVFFASTLFMLIGIDAHNLEGKRTGVGRYLFNLLKVWSAWQIGESLNTLQYLRNCQLKFILYFKDEIPADLPKSDLFDCKLLSVSSTAKFIHWDLWRAAKKDRVEILFCPGYVAPLYYRGKIALTLHDIVYEAHPEWFNWPSPADKILLKWVSKKSARKAAVIFVPSEFSRQEVIKFYGVNPSKVVLTYGAADSSFQYHHSDNDTGKSAESAEMKKKYGIGKEFGFFVGSIFTRRHLPEIIEAFIGIAKKYPNCQFLAGGRDYTSGRAVDKLAEKINRELGREAILRVDFIGDNELKLLYSACAFFIWLSDYEGFGFPPLEAMNVGVPVITSDSTSLKEVAGKAALLIKDNSDIEEIYRAMERLVEDEVLRQGLIAKGKEQAKKFSWERCAEETLNLLTSV